jgi:hypothetical protein
MIVAYVEVNPHILAPNLYYAWAGVPVVWVCFSEIKHYVC